MSVRKAVVPSAGFGTRFLPVTRSVPKNMLPIYDTPSIHYCVEEAASAGIEEVIFVVSENQEAIPRYFERWSQLENALSARGNTPILEQMRRITDLVKITCVAQTEQKGLGHAILMARDAVGDEPFAVFLPDDVIWADEPAIGDMITIHERTGGFVVALMEARPEAIPNLGIVDVGGDDGANPRIIDMIEKPALEDAPSNLAIIGRYVLCPEIFDSLESVSPGALGEIQLTDGIAAHIEAPGVLGNRIRGEHYDVGTPLGMLKASVAAALKREDAADDLREWLQEAIRLPASTSTREQR